MHTAVNDVTVVIHSCHGLGLGHGSRVVRVTGQLTDGSRGSRVTKCDPLSALAGTLHGLRHGGPR